MLLLIVDDWELLERYEERFSESFEVLCAPLGSEGIRLAREHLPELVLLYLHFENMTNHEVCLALREDPVTGTLPIAAVGVSGPGPGFWIQEPLLAANLLALLKT